MVGVQFEELVTGENLRDSTLSWNEIAPALGHAFGKIVDASEPGKVLVIKDNGLNNIYYNPSTKTVKIIDVGRIVFYTDITTALMKDLRPSSFYYRQIPVQNYPDFFKGMESALGQRRTAAILKHVENRLLNTVYKYSIFDDKQPNPPTIQERSNIAQKIHEYLNNAVPELEAIEKKAPSFLSGAASKTVLTDVTSYENLLKSLSDGDLKPLTESEIELLLDGYKTFYSPNSATPLDTFKVDIKSSAGIVEFAKKIQEVREKGGSVNRPIGTTVYLFRDGAAMMVADRILTRLRSRSPDNIRGAMISSHTFNARNSIERSPLGNVIYEVYDKLKTSPSIKLSDFYKEYREQFFKTMAESPELRSLTVQIVGHMKEEGILKTHNGKLIPQTVLFVDTCCRSIPPYLKAAVEWYAENIDGLQPGDVVGDIYFGSVSPGYEFLPNAGAKYIEFERIGERSSFLAGKSGEITPDSNKPKINLRDDNLLFASWVQFLALREKAIEMGP